jgi:transposase-like protein
MNLKDIVLNYLTDNEEGMQQLITWFLNDVMNEEGAQQAGVSRYKRSSSRRAHRNGFTKNSNAEVKRLGLSRIMLPY